MDGWSPLARTVALQKYCLTRANGTKESWDDVAARVAQNVCGAAPVSGTETAEIQAAVAARTVMPGGRYLAASGRPFHQVQNCFLLRAEDTSTGWADLMYKSTAALMSGGGIGVDYSALRAQGAPLKTKGGVSSGPLALMHMVNEAGRYIRQGGERRSAIWAGLNWNHPDALEFLEAKTWTDAQRKSKEADPDFPMPLEGTNISLILDRAFFDAYAAGDAWARSVYRLAVDSMLRTGEPGFSVDYANHNESLRNAPVTGSTRVLTDTGYRPVAELVGVPTTVWTGIRWAPNVVFKLTKAQTDVVTVELTNGRSITCDPEHPFLVRHYKGSKQSRKIHIERVAASQLCEDDKIQSDLPQDLPNSDSLDYALGFVYGDGSYKDGRGELSFWHESKRAAFEQARSLLGARTGEHANRAYFVRPLGNSKQDWITPTQLTPGFLAGWFDADGCWTRDLLRLSCADQGALKAAQEALDRCGIKSVVRKDAKSGYTGEYTYTLQILASSLPRFAAVIPTVRVVPDVGADWVPYRESEIRVRAVHPGTKREDVFCADVGYAEHSFMAEGVLVSNCTEAVSEDDSDVCNLGSVNMARVADLDAFVAALRACTTLLMAGSLYSDVPYPAVADVRDRNRRVGVGLMGLHDWLLKRGLAYEESPELAIWLNVYREVTSETAERLAKAWGVTVPVACRAIAPTGSIAIVGETTSGIEPIYSVAYKRRYRGEDGVLQYQYVVDPTAKRLIDGGVKPEAIEDAYHLAQTPERRVAFQAYVQGYVDQGISSTVNLPKWGSEHNSEATKTAFAEMLMGHLPKLRGITCFPDGSRGAQPLTPVRYETAMAHEGQVFIEQADVCELSGGGSCGA